MTDGVILHWVSRAKRPRQLCRAGGSHCPSEKHKPTRIAHQRALYEAGSASGDRRAATKCSGTLRVPSSNPLNTSRPLPLQVELEPSLPTRDEPCLLYWDSHGTQNHGYKSCAFHLGTDGHCVGCYLGGLGTAFVAATRLMITHAEEERPRPGTGGSGDQDENKPYCR